MLATLGRAALCAQGEVEAWDTGRRVEGADLCLRGGFVQCVFVSCVGAPQSGMAVPEGACLRAQMHLLSESVTAFQYCP